MEQNERHRFAVAAHTCATAIPVERTERDGDNKYRFAIRSFETTDCIVQTIRAGVSGQRRRDRHSESETKLGPAARTTAVRQVDSSRVFLRMRLRLLHHWYCGTAGFRNATPYYIRHSRRYAPCQRCRVVRASLHVAVQR